MPARQPPGAGDPPRVTLARLARPRGRVGELAAQILTDFPERLTKLKVVFLSREAGGERPRSPGAALLPAVEARRMRVRRCWLHKGQAIFHFEGVDSINDAEKLVGCEVQVPLTERVSLPQGRYWVTDLIGCEVWEKKEVEEVKEAKEVEEKTVGAIANGADLSSTSLTSSTSSTSLIGHVRDVQLNTGTPLLVVDAAEGELLIPLAEEICARIDPAARRIEVRLPAGLRDLNRR